ncbi:MAG: hypothetical protein ACYCOU_01275 [Sulfobacillus sp.]
MPKKTDLTGFSKRKIFFGLAAGFAILLSVLYVATWLLTHGHAWLGTFVVLLVISYFLADQWYVPAAKKAGEEKVDSDEPVKGDDPGWIVNDHGELGVKVRGHCYFLYKGRSMEYEDGPPVMYRPVGKYEFGEVCYPVDFQTHSNPDGTYTVELMDDPVLDDYKWRPLPTTTTGGT